MCCFCFSAQFAASQPDLSHPRLLLWLYTLTLQKLDLTLHVPQSALVTCTFLLRFYHKLRRNSCCFKGKSLSSTFIWYLDLFFTLHKWCCLSDLSFTLVLSLLCHVEALRSRVSPSLWFYNRPPRPQTVLEMELACRKMTDSADALQKHQHSSACITAGPVTERHLSGFMRVYLCLPAAVICHQHLLYTPRILFRIPVRQCKGEKCKSCTQRKEER